MTSAQTATMQTSAPPSVTAQKLVQVPSQVTGKSQETTNELPSELQRAVLVVYRSFGLGIWGCVLRSAGMPLEKVALEANSGRVSGNGSQLMQAIKQVYARGFADPFLCITTRSLRAWFLQYGMMGFTFQLLDIGLSRVLGVPSQPIGPQVFMKQDTETSSSGKNSVDVGLMIFKGVAAPLLAGGVESFVANKAECERYLGPAQLSRVMGSKALATTVVSRVAFAAGPAFLPNMLRNFVMAEVSFVATPNLFRATLSDDQKTPTSLFWFGLGMNVFIGNGIAIMLQSLWGRSLDHLHTRKGVTGTQIQYPTLIRSALNANGMKAFFSPGKWCARVLMNAPAQGTIPWFNNVVLPLGDKRVLAMATSVYSVVKR